MRGGHARAAFVLSGDGDVHHARGDFATQVIYPPPASAMSRGWTSLRTGSHELLVFVALTDGALLAGVFGADANAEVARRQLEELVTATYGQR